MFDDIINPATATAPVEPDPLEEVETAVTQALTQVAGALVGSISEILRETKHPARALHLIETLAHKHLEMLSVVSAEARNYLPPPEGAVDAPNPSETFGATLIREVLPIATAAFKARSEPKFAPVVHARRADFYGIDAAVRALKDAKEAGEKQLEDAIREAIRTQVEPPPPPAPLPGEELES